MRRKLKIILVSGARPNFMKIAPLINEFKKLSRFDWTLVHTGQHYDKKMSQIFFDELGIPAPDVNLGVGSGTHAEQTGRILIKFDEVLSKIKPDLVIVVGDVNSTIACSLAAKKRAIPVAHVEAGLRSFDWTMPEEINRVLTDRIADFLFCTEPSAVSNLKREGADMKKVHFVGNVMIDTLLKHKAAAEKSKIRKILNLPDRYAVLTLHRPANVDNEKNLKKIFAILRKISSRISPIIFPVHPRTKKNMGKWAVNSNGVTMIEPLGYLDFLSIISHSTFVLTDSGGIQEETTVLGVPCLTLRENTERPVTVTNGTNVIVGADEEKILKTVSKILNNLQSKPRWPKLWDGRAAERIVKILSKL